MEPENKLRIQANQKELVQTIEVSDVQDHLVQFGLLTDEEQEWVTMKTITRHEGVRRLIKVIQKKPNIFNKFCDALEEAHGWLADKIRNTDPSTVTPPDDIDGAEKEKMQQLQSQLWMTNQLIQKFKEEIDSLKNVVEEQADENRVIKHKFSELEKAMSQQGLGQQDQLREYLEDYVHKKEHPNRAAIECPDGSSVDVQPKLKRYSMGDPTNLTEAIARHLAVDVVRFMVDGPDRARPPSNRYAAVMRQMVTVLETRYHNTFFYMLKKLTIDEINGYATLTAVANEMFKDDVGNWGRIVTLYGFGGYIAKNTAGVDDSFGAMIGDFLGFYVSTKLASKIEECGGWEAFVEYFHKEMKEEDHDALWKKILLSVVGIAGVGLLGTAVVKRS